MTEDKIEILSYVVATIVASLVGFTMYNSLTKQEDKPSNCMHYHLGTDVIEFCSKQIECSSSEDSTGSVKICRIKKQENK